MALDLERIREYNKKCNDYKAKLANTVAERKIMNETLNNLCNQLTQQLGIQVTPDNLEGVYQERAQAIEKTLESGEEILRRIEASEGGDAEASIPASGGFDNVTPVTASQVGGNVGGFDGNAGGFDSNAGAPQQFGAQGFGTPVRSAGGNGMPESSYKIPAEFAKSMPSNPFMAGAQLNGPFSGLKVNDADVDSI